MSVLAPATASLTAAQLAAYQAAFEADPANRIAMNACSAGNVDDIALNRRLLAGVDWTFSHEVKTGEVSNQKRAGFCWLFAALNWLRVDVIKARKLEHFEFSHNYLIFYDRLEKANRFLAAMVAMRDREPGDRAVEWMLREPCPDAGEWHMVANLIRKYGLVPKAAMADTANLEDSTFLNKVVDQKLRQAAARIFATPDEAAARAIQHEAMGDVYRILAILLGEPPATFDFCYRDKDEAHHALRGLTPRTFYEQVVGRDLDDHVWVMSAPLPDTPFGGTYYVERFQNVVEGQWGVFLNVEMPALKAMAVAALKDGEALMFGCDVLQASHRKRGVLDPEVLDYDLLFRTSFHMDRGDRIRFYQSTLTHDMVLLGVDLVDGKPTKWKIENSWGDESGLKGAFQMSDGWFDEHMYALVVPKKYLTAEQLAQAAQPPVALPAWHPLA